MKNVLKVLAATAVAWRTPLLVIQDEFSYIEYLIVYIFYINYTFIL